MASRLPASRASWWRTPLPAPESDSMSLPGSRTGSFPAVRCCAGRRWCWRCCTTGSGTCCDQSGASGSRRTLRNASCPRHASPLISPRFTKAGRTSRALTHNSIMHNVVTGTASNPARWRAADLEIDVGLQRVERNGACIELPRLSFELLLALLRGAPHFLSNEELMARVWKGLVVSPETVTQRVKLLRDALGDDPKHPRYIEGLRGRGYRMIPSVSAASVSSPQAEAVVVTREPAPAQVSTAR